ncbi:response regulator transcription factor [Sphingobium sp. WTD-1]|uniref:response regulator n=1 Tax=Sphingobium sp. WTD-1 TaxID=2979467 RepID=UPI0024DE0D2C|nr:response regulator transcription factor [Sphingobium sp. WTD-1]WIA54134.1 response regulator transcription factor [Sphingobium sp. WTD-1]
MSKPLTRILIADDHQALRQGVRTFLETQDRWQIVAEASDGHDALKAARETQPDIAILDYSLPLMNGLELTRALKQEFPRIEILIYTMHDREDLLVEVLRAGARGYVLKSDSDQHLQSAVEALSLRKPYFSAAISETLLDHYVKSSVAGSNVATLTPREREIVQLIAEGKINKQIAHLLDISVKTVETHRAAAMHKLKLGTTAELVRYAVRNNIVEP